MRSTESCNAHAIQSYEGRSETGRGKAAGGLCGYALWRECGCRAPIPWNARDL